METIGRIQGFGWESVAHRFLGRLCEAVWGFSLGSWGPVGPQGFRKRRPLIIWFLTSGIQGWDVI